MTGLPPADALLHAATQFQLGFDVRGPFEKRKRRKRVVTTSAGEVAALDDERGPTRPAPERVHLDLEPPGS